MAAPRKVQGTSYGPGKKGMSGEMDGSDDWQGYVGGQIFGEHVPIPYDKNSRFGECEDWDGDECPMRHDASRKYENQEFLGHFGSEANRRRGHNTMRGYQDSGMAGQTQQNADSQKLNDAEAYDRFFAQIQQAQKPQ